MYISDGKDFHDEDFEEEPSRSEGRADVAVMVDWSREASPTSTVENWDADSDGVVHDEDYGTFLGEHTMEPHTPAEVPAGSTMVENMPRGDTPLSDAHAWSATDFEEQGNPRAVDDAGCTLGDNVSAEASQSLNLEYWGPGGFDGVAYGEEQQISMEVGARYASSGNMSAGV